MQASLSNRWRARPTGTRSPDQPARGFEARPPPVEPVCRHPALDTIGKLIQLSHEPGYAEALRPQAIGKLIVAVRVVLFLLGTVVLPESRERVVIDARFECGRPSLNLPQAGCCGAGVGTISVAYLEGVE